MMEMEKAKQVRRMLERGRELSEEQRTALLKLHARFEQLWARREPPQPSALSQRRAEADARR